jgi:hypothetical protein
MADIPVYNSSGHQVDVIFIPDTLEYIDGRISKGQKYYYKGLGIPYRAHNLYLDAKVVLDDYDIISKSEIFYIGNIVSKKCYQGKYGIFQEKFQSHFTDWIGACGVKELNIFENLYDENGFEMNAIDVFEYKIIDADNQQYYLEVDYPYGRKKYLDNPNSNNLRKLIDYMIQNNWNFPWDKNSVSDISISAKVTDVADIFKSEELSHKIGSVYSILYSLFAASKQEYLNFCQYNNIGHQNEMSFIFNSLYFLSSNNVEIEHLFKQNPTETYKNIILNYLVSGKNCGFCGVGSCKKREDSNQSYGEEIKSEYIKIVKHQLSI